MRTAIIDLGTNSVRFGIQEFGDGKKVTQLYREKIMIRLGENVFTSGRLSRAAILRATHAFLKFKRICQEFHVERIIVFGTSALREAKDAGSFVAALKSKTGIDVRVISGEEEARLIALGVLQNHSARKGYFALIDIGGGSTEISICRGKVVKDCESFALGTARIQQVFLKKIPPTEKSAEELRLFVRGKIQQHAAAKNWPRVPVALGSSGTIKAVAKILKKKTGKNHIDHKDLRKLVKSMTGMTRAELAKIPGMESKRVDMILSGAILLEECMQTIGATKTEVTLFSLRDGILAEEQQLYRQRERTYLAFHLSDLNAICSRFGVDRKHLTPAVHLAGSLFDQLKRFHQLGPGWKPYLIAATMLKSTGKIVSPVHYQTHSYYLVKNMHLPGMAPWEQEFVAQLCLHSGSSELPDFGALSFGGSSMKSQRRRKAAFQKLLAILSIIDAVESETTVPKLKKVRVARNQIHLSLSRNQSSGLEAINLDNRKKLYRKLLGRQVIADLL